MACLIGVGGALAIFISQLLSPGVAQADANQPDRPDKGTHTFCFDPVLQMAAAVMSRARYAMDNNDGVEAQTVVGTQEHNCGPSIDVRFQQFDLGFTDDGGVILGWADCIRELDNGRCDQHQVVVDWASIRALSPAANEGYGARHTLCHEIGHSLGVRHYSGTSSPDEDNTGEPLHSCLRSGLWDDGLHWQRSYGTHHRTVHINPYFSTP